MYGTGSITAARLDSETCKRGQARQHDRIKGETILLSGEGVWNISNLYVFGWLQKAGASPPNKTKPGCGRVGLPVGISIGVQYY